MRITQVLFWRAKDVVKPKKLDVLDQVGEMTKRFSNLPDSYIRRSMRQIGWDTPKDPRYLDKTIERKKFHFSIHRPWTANFYYENMPNTRKAKVYIEPIETWSFFKGDRVEVLVGRDKGKQGYITQVFQERNWVIVGGLNWKYETVGKQKDFPGTILRKEMPLLVTSEIKLVDPGDCQPTDIEWRFTEQGQRVRVSMKSGRVIPIPASNDETYDYKSKNVYVERPKDTVAAAASEITFEPKLKTFEMDIMDEMNIEEDRVPKRTYWY